MPETEDETPRPKVLGHLVPPWVENGATFFITICLQPRGENQLCHDDVAAVLFETTAYREQQHQWHCRLMLLMPDHLHALIAFPADTDMRATLTAFKRYVSSRAPRPITWQRDFFDHRIRDHENLDQKYDYIRQNPVRAGLIQQAEDWPYFWPR